jgi:hypothetical protein
MRSNKKTSSLFINDFIIVCKVAWERKTAHDSRRKERGGDGVTGRRGDGEIGRRGDIKVPLLGGARGGFFLFLFTPQPP